MPSSRPAAPDADQRVHRGLSPREKAVLTELARGLSLDQAAAVLAVRRTTAKTFLKRACQKLGQRTTAGAVALAVYTRQIDLGR